MLPRDQLGEVAYKAHLKVDGLDPEYCVPWDMLPELIKETHRVIGETIHGKLFPMDIGMAINVTPEHFIFARKVADRLMALAKDHDWGALKDHEELILAHLDGIVAQILETL